MVGKPYVRRRWPATLVSWSRLLAGGFLLQSTKKRQHQQRKPDEKAAPGSGRGGACKRRGS